MRSRLVIVVSVLGGSLVTGGWLLKRGVGEGTPSVSDRARLFDEVRTRIAREYVDTIGDARLYRMAVDGMLGELHDPHTVFLSPERLQRLTEVTTGRYGGVGIQIEPRSGTIVVVAPLPGTPAERAGIQTGDHIVEIEGKPTIDWTADEAMRVLRGEPGTVVRFIVERPGVPERMPFVITRRDIHVRSVQNASILRDSVGYVDVNVFGESTVEELRDAIVRLQRRGLTSLVIDLRGNPGGLLDQGVAVSDVFLDPGQRIVSTRGRARDANRDFVDREPQRWPNLPIVVLIDSGSASASEIVAGAWQDHDRAVVLGTTSFGKGSAQNVYGMPGGGALKLTTALWYTPVGRTITRPLSPDSADDDAEALPLLDARAADTAGRPAYRTDGGRRVYGGGGITPDIIVGSQTAPREELALQRALGDQVPRFRDALNDYVTTLRTSRRVTTPAFEVTPSMREELWSRMGRRGITMDRAVYDSAATLVDRLLGYEIARFVFGAEAEFERAARHDPAIGAAVELAAGVRSRRELLDRAARHPKSTSGATARE